MNRATKFLNRQQAKVEKRRQTLEYIVCLERETRITTRNFIRKNSKLSRKRFARHEGGTI